MASLGSSSLSAGKLLRMAADGILVNVGFLGALALRFILDVGFNHTIVAGDELLAEYWQIYWQNAAVLTLIHLLVYSLLGFYSYGTWYNGRFKPLVIAKAVLISHVVFGMMTYMFWDRLEVLEIPRGALVMTALFTALLCIGARVCSYLWDRVLRPEKEKKIKSSRKKPEYVLVIGGAGYIGSALLPKLLDKGMRVRVLDRFLYGRDPISKFLNHPRVDLIEGDFRDVATVMRAMDGVDAVVHLGAIVGDPGCNLDEKVTKGVNLLATKNIAEIAREYGVQRFVFASTCSVYGATDETLDEASQVEPISLYGRTKLAAEDGLLAMATEEFQPTIVRFATIYGFSGRTRFDLVINLLTAMAKVEGKITVHGGDQWRPFVHVDDAAKAVAMMLEAPMSKVANQIFNVGSDDQNYTIQQIGEMIHQRVVSAKLMINNNTTDKRNYRVSFAKIARVIGFRPSWTVEQGIEQVLDAISGGEVENFKDSRYSNVLYLSENGLIETLRDDTWTQRLQKIEEPERRRAASITAAKEEAEPARPSGSDSKLVKV